jgi:hypothetical protein
MTSKTNGNCIKGRHPIIFNFIECRDEPNGCGYFEGDQEAIDYAKDVGKNQERKWKRHGIIPKQFVKMIAKHFVYQDKANPIYRDITYGEFLTMLMRGPYKNTAARQVGEKLYHDLIVKEMPWLERSFAKWDGFYNGHEKQRPSKRDQGKMGKEVTPMRV